MRVDTLEDAHRIVVELQMNGGRISSKTRAYEARVALAKIRGIAYLSGDRTDKNIDAINYLEVVIDKWRKRDSDKKPKSFRKAFSYNSAFVKIGRRDGFYCQYCGYSGSDLEIDHIRPVSKGGTNKLSNLQLLCQSCNRKKGNKYG